MGLVLTSAGLLSVGCAHPDASITGRATPYRDQNINVVEPGFFVVHKPAVTPKDIHALEPVYIPRKGADRAVTEEERTIGASLASAIQREIVARMNAAGIEAYAAGAKDETSFKVGILQGYFFEGSSENPETHELGFNLTDNAYRVRFVANVKEVPIAAMTFDVNKSRLHDTDDDDMAVRIDREAATIAKKLVDEAVVPAYKARGWLK